MRVRRLAPVLLLPVVLLAGCTGSSDDSAASTAAVGEASSGSAGEAPAGSAGGEVSRDAAPAADSVAAPGVAGAAVGSSTPVTVGRSVVRTASLVVEVPDVRPAADRARAVAEAAGGSLEAEDASSGSDVLRLRVAPDRLATSLDALARLGRELSRTVGSEDVTEQVADLDSRLATQRASVERVRALLSEADALSDVVALEAQLTSREADLESLQSRVAAVRAQADLATVTLTLQVPGPGPVAAVSGDPGFLDGLRGGLDALRASTRAIAVVVGALLPFLPVLAVALVVLRRRRAAPPA